MRLSAERRGTLLQFHKSKIEDEGKKGEPRQVEEWGILKWEWRHPGSLHLGDMKGVHENEWYAMVCYKCKIASELLDKF